MRIKLLMPDMMEDIKVWAQMFFDDGSVTQGLYISHKIFDDKRYIKTIALDFLDDTKRKEGVLFIWGAGMLYARKAKLSIIKKGELKEKEVLKLSRI